MRSASGADAAYSVEEFRKRCAQRLPRGLMDFYEGGAENEETLQANGVRYRDHPLWPRVFCGVQKPDYRQTLFGQQLPIPFGIAPMGALGFGWPQADQLLSHAAAAMDTVYTLSTMACATIEEIAATPCTHRWFQAHLFLPRRKTLDLIDRARDNGFETLVITADLPVGGKRGRDLSNRFKLPFKIQAQHLLDFACHPRWLIDILRRGVPSLPNLPADAGQPGHSTIGQGFDASFDWAALDDIRSVWPGPLVIKGILRPDDALHALDCGADAVWVSNHGGRQLDGCVSSLTALAAIKRVVGARAPILFDGGIRRGQHILKALALGADFVFLGRAALYGVCADGERGALATMRLLEDELKRCMQLCNLASLQEAQALLSPDIR